MAETGKPMIMSTGMATEEEIAEAVDAARGAGCTELVLLHCISSYPAPMDQANIRQLAELGRRFDAVPGLSDHTLGVTASIAATAVGACLIEKHFTLSRADKGPDSEFSIEPDELKRLSQETHDAWQALGQVGYNRQPAEEGARFFVGLFISCVTCQLGLSSDPKIFAVFVLRWVWLRSILMICWGKS